MEKEEELLDFDVPPEVHVLAREVRKPTNEVLTKLIRTGLNRVMAEALASNSSLAEIVSRI